MGMDALPSCMIYTTCMSGPFIGEESGFSGSGVIGGCELGRVSWCSTLLKRGIEILAPVLTWLFTVYCHTERDENVETQIGRCPLLLSPRTGAAAVQGFAVQPGMAEALRTSRPLHGQLCPSQREYQIRDAVKNI